MNMQARPPRTPAEQALIDSFGTRLADLPGDAALTTARDRLMGEFGERGLPSRRIEAWHYTDLRTLLRTVPDLNATGSADTLAPLVEKAAALPVVQGGFAKTVELEDGVTAESLRERLMAGEGGTLAPLDRHDVIALVNGAFVTDGYVLDLAEDAAPATPIELQAVQNGGQANTRFVLQAGRGARATIIERQAAAGDKHGFSTSLSQLKLAEETDITWIILQERGAEDTHLGQLRAELAAGARLRLFVVNAGGKLVRQEVHVAIEGEGAHFDLRGINLLAGDTHTDVTLTLGHSVPHTTSSEVVRNVVLDKARGVFQGQIRVARPAQKTDAQMACNTLLLSDQGEFDAKPELEIFADDVVCAHGATVADLDPVHMFYLAARGVPEQIARALLINGFVDELVDELGDEEIADALKARIEEWLKTHA